MGFFDKFRSDGATYDGQGEERRGLIDVVQYNGEADDLLWRFPYDNLSTRTQLVVQEGQEAVFSSGGRIADIFGPGTHTLKTNNIPILQKLINLPFGGDSPFKATACFVNTTTRVAKWGTSGPVAVRDYSLGDVGMQIKVAGYGNCSVRVVDSAMFIREFAGTIHTITADEFVKQFRAKISQHIKPAIAKYFELKRASITQISMFLTEISLYMQDELNGYFERFGVKVTDFAIEALNADEDDPNYQKILEAQQEAASLDTRSDAEARRFAKFGTSYQQERQFDVLQTAAANEGTAGTVLGGGMGLGMGLGVGTILSNSIGQMGNAMMSQGAVPPPPPPTVTFFILVNNQQQGPYGMPQLMQLAQQGVLTPATLVWKQGMSGWAAAQTCPDLMPLFNAGAGAPPPPPPVM